VINSKNILITGGTGSWGYELTKQLLAQNPAKIVIYSRNESTQVAMKRELDDKRLIFCIGDIRDKAALLLACKGIDIVFHLAALKHVSICEEQPLEALKTNVTGTQNVIEAAIENNVSKVVHVSTDKAADPTNFYGMTKAIGEKLMIFANLQYPDTKFICVRGGNILGSNGSVLHFFKKQIREKKQVGITDMRMTRFFLTPQQATELLLQAAAVGLGGETFIMAMPACKIIDLAEVLIESSGCEGVGVIETGTRPGEKLHELLMTDFESHNGFVYNERYLVILPSLDIPNLRSHYQGYPRVNMATYRSDEHWMTKAEIKEMLVQGGFLP